MTTLGGYLRSLRLCQDEISLDKMAKKIGCCKSYLSDVENNKIMPSLAKSVLIAKHYKTTLNLMSKYL